MIAAARIVAAHGNRAILDGLSLALAPGELTIVAGPNGAGKSTLLKALTGSLALRAGQITLDGRPLAGWPRRSLAQRTAVVSQGHHIAFPFTVFEVVALGRGIWDAPSSAACRRLVMECLSAVDLAAYEGRLYQQLSGGEQQRVQIARAFCQLGGPHAGADASGVARWLFLDEPTSSLDVSHQLAVLDLARAHVRAGGGALAILHDLNLASLYADRLILMAGGAIVADSAAEDVLSEPCLRSVFGDRIMVKADPITGRRYVLPCELAQ